MEAVRVPPLIAQWVVVIVQVEVVVIVQGAELPVIVQEEEVVVIAQEAEVAVGVQEVEVALIAQEEVAQAWIVQAQAVQRLPVHHPPHTFYQIKRQVSEIPNILIPQRNPFRRRYCDVPPFHR